jgi:hypothetical protein
MARTIRFHLDECCDPAIADGYRGDVNEPASKDACRPNWPRDLAEAASK